MISRSTIDDVYQTARVEEVIGDFVSLKKSGSNYKGLSPFSQERTPSFMVSPVKQIWKDFSSGKGGNVVAFLMEHEHFTYPEAIRYLAKKYNIEIEETIQTDAQKEQANEKESLFLVSQFAQEYFEKNLFETQEGKAIGKTYFESRGFSESTMKHFGLGYALDDKTALHKSATKAGYSESFLEKSGLIIKNERGSIDRFRARVIFPIRSLAGRVQGFGGRILSKNIKTAKYLNSPESDIYHKSKVLYGLFEGKQAIAKSDLAYLVEGYTDVIQMYQSGIQNVVASSGTALTPDQIRLIRRLTQNMVVLFDGDAAGTRAALRGVDLILEQGMNVRVCSFPDGEDPDSFAQKKNLEELTDFLENNAQDFIQYKTNLLIQESGDDPVKKAQTIREIVQSIAKIPDLIQQELYIKRCATLLDVSENVLFNTLAQVINKQKKEKKTRPLQPQGSDFEVVKTPRTDDLTTQALPHLEKQLISILLYYGNEEVDFDEIFLTANEEGVLEEEPKIIKAKVFEKIFLDLQQDEIAFVNSDFQALYDLLMGAFQTEGSVIMEKLLQECNDNLGQLLSDLLLEDEVHQLHQWDKKNIFVKAKKASVGQLVSETILSLRRILIDQKIEAMTNTKEDLGEKESNLVLEEIMQYQNLKKILSRKLNRVL